MTTPAAQLSLVRPRSLKEALDLLADAAEKNAPLTPLAGGTDLFVTLNAGVARETRFLDLWSLDELRGITAHEGGLRFGALATYSDCAASPLVQKCLPILVEAALQVGGVQIQNRGTIAGNVGNGSPAGDSLPVLAAADAIVTLDSVNGERDVPLHEFYRGYRDTVRRPYELITRITLPKPRGKQRFVKVGTRAAQAISKVAMAAIGPQIAFGSVGPTVLRARNVEAYLRGGGRELAAAQRALEKDIAPIDDIRSTGDYRMQVAKNLLHYVVS